MNAPRRHARIRRFLSILWLVLLAVVGAGVTVTFAGARQVRWQAFEVQARIRPGLRGETRLILTPLGEVRAATHKTPLLLTVDLEAVSFDKLRKTVAKMPPRETLEKDFRRTARGSLIYFSLWQVVLGAIGGILAPLIARRLRRLRDGLFAAGIGGGFVAMMLLLTLLTFDSRAFASPKYTGSLREAPAVIHLAQTAFSSYKSLSAKLSGVAGNLNTLYGRLNNSVSLLPPASDPETDDEKTIRLLHVSDIHNNPAAIEFVRTLAERFAVDAVIDTGDLSDFGSPVETQLTRGLAAIPVPYVFAAGNHDSQATIKALRAANSRAVILEGEAVVVAGLTILGGPDPSALRPGVGDVNTSPEALMAAGQELLSHAQAARPDIVCVHNPRQAEPVLIGQVPLVLCGHMHRAVVETVADENGNETVLCNAGTTGGAGWRYFDRKEGVPFTAAILTLTKPGEKAAARLRYIDLISLEGSLEEYSITRRAFDVEEQDAATSAESAAEGESAESPPTGAEAESP